MLLFYIYGINIACFSNMNFMSKIIHDLFRIIIAIGEFILIFSYLIFLAEIQQMNSTKMCRNLCF